jgi:hypothetical protein
MSHEREGKEKTGKKAPAKNLKEKRAAKAAKRDSKGPSGKLFSSAPVPKPGKQ